MVRVKVKINNEDHETLNLEDGKRYLFGRRKDCDFVMKSYPGLSRAHFCLDLTVRPYQLEVTENARPLILDGAEVTRHAISQTVALELDPYTFIFEPTIGGKALSAESASAHFEDITQVHSAQEYTPYIILKSGSPEKSIKLLGAHWIAGRDDASDVVIQHSRASRQQFEIFSKEGRYYIRDLNSSHGTHVMGEKISSVTPHELKSGDVIDVEGFSLAFELRDPNFDKQVSQSADSSLSLLKNFVPAKWGSQKSPEESVVVLEQPAGGLSHRKKLHIGVAALALILIYVFTGGSPEESKERSPTSTEQAAEDPFAKLNPSQQDIVRHSFRLADNLVKQQKFELALEQLARVHTYVPQYQNSRELESVALQYRQIRDQQNYLERQRRQLAAVNDKVQEILKSCEPVAARATSLREIETCLQPALELNPTHPDHARLIGIVQERMRQREEAERERARHQSRVNQGVALYNTAKALDEKGSVLEAIKAYDKHVASNFPDPRGLKSKSRQRSIELEQGIKSQKEELMKEARGLASSGDLGGGILSAQKATKLAPNDADIAEFIDEKSNELLKKLKSIYTESVLEERFGNIDAAKAKWEKILELDLPGGEYAGRAESKLKQYGGK